MAFDSRQEPYHVEYISEQALVYVEGNLVVENMSHYFLHWSGRSQEKHNQDASWEASLMLRVLNLWITQLGVERKFILSIICSSTLQMWKTNILVQLANIKGEKLLNLLVSANQPVRALARSGFTPFAAEE